MTLKKNSSEFRAVLESGLECHRKGEFGRARILYEKALGIDPDEPNALFLLGRLLIQTGENEPAVSLLARAVELSENPAPFYSALAVGLQNLGKNREARQICLKAISFQPQDANAHNTLGNALRALGRLDDAEQCFRRALSIRPDAADIHANLAHALKEQGKWAEAAQSYAAALELRPDATKLLFALGEAFQQLGKLQEARQCYLQVIAKTPDFSDAHFQLAVVCHELRLLEEAAAYLRKCIELDPSNDKAHKNLAAVYYEQGSYEAALECYEAAFRICPTDGLKVILSTLLPPIADSVEQIEQVRNRLDQNLDALAAGRLFLNDPLKEVGNPRFFYLTYQGRDDRRIMEKLARLYRPFLPSRMDGAGARPKPGGDKIRIGFISKFFLSHSVGLFFGKIIEAIAREPEFEVILLSVGTQQDAVLDRIAGACAEHIQVPADLASAREMIAGKELDILFYTDIGMEPFTYYLAFTRLAQVQCATIGHLVTTGIDAMDYYISSRLIEPPGAQAHYSENLVLLDNMPCWMEPPEPPQKTMTRGELGLPENRNLYICPMRLQKIHPEFDRAMGEILRLDPKAEIILFKDAGDGNNWHHLLTQRFERSIGRTDRMRFIPWADPESFKQVLLHADVALDSFYYGGGVTSYIVFATATPMATWPGPLMRGRMTAGCLEKMQVPECIARTQEQYVKLALRLANDAAFRASIRGKILQNSSWLYGDTGVASELIDFFKKAVSKIR